MTWRRFILCLLTVGCTLPVDVTSIDDAPRVTLLEPSPDARLVPGPVTFQVLAVDDRDPPERLFVRFSLAREVDGARTWTDACSGRPDDDSLARCTAELTADTVALRVVAFDLAGYEGRLEQPLAVVPGAAPVVEASLEPARRYYEGQQYVLSATASDADHPTSALSLAWSSTEGGDLAGPATLGPDGTASVAFVAREGLQTLRVAATDPDGLVGEATLEVAVTPPSEPPRCGVTRPADGAVLSSALAEIGLEAWATDDDQPDEDLVLAWTSDLAGPLGVLPSLVVDPGVLGLGTHTLTFTATDEVGLSCEASVVAVVDAPPTLIVLDPPPDAVRAGPTVAIALEVADLGTPPPELVVDVRSSLGIGSVARAGPDEDGAVTLDLTLTPGDHDLTFTVVDPLGLSASVSQTLTITAP